MDNIKLLEDSIVSFLTPDLLNKKWLGIVSEKDVRGTGHCYIAAEVAYHLSGGKSHGWKHKTLTHKLWPDGLSEGETHHYIVHENGDIIDPTRDQFGNIEIPYEKGIGGGFLTGEKPSKRAVEVMRRMGR
jgi:hypothetical protein